MPDAPWEPALQLDPQVYEAGRRYLASDPGLRDLAALGVEQARARTAAARRAWNLGGPVMAETRDLALPGPRRQIPARLYRPDGEAGGAATLFLHGGGFVLGDLDTHDRVMRELAAATGRAVLGLDYALGPERPFPAAFDEVEAAVLDLAERHREFGLATGRVVLAGDSSGARLALATCLAPAVRAAQSVAGALLFYGSYGLRDSASRRLYAGGAFGLGARELAFFTRNHLRAPADAEDPRLDPLGVEAAEALGALPPLFVAAAELDPLRDDSLALHWRVRAAGGRSELAVARGLPHGYLLFLAEVDAAAASLAAAGAFAAALS